MRWLIFSMMLFTHLACMALEPAVFSELMDKAMEGRSRAYAPYSNYSVGAALLTKSGKIYSGCNVENASYGLCNCAERTAVFKAVSEKERDFEAILIITKDGGLSCGACRQVLNEFSPHMTIIAVNENREIICELTLDQLFPHAFGPSNLE